MITTKNFTTKKFVNALLEDAKKIETENKRKESLLDNIYNESFSTNDGIIKASLSAESLAAKKRTFNENVKTALLSECLYKIYNEAFGLSISNDGDESIKRAFVNNYIKENGVNDLLGRFKYTSNLLSEMSLLVNKYSRSILEKAEKEKDYSIDPEIKDQFFKDLNIMDSGEATESIRMRVTSAVDEFIQNNINNKMDIEDTINDIKEKIALTKDESVKESYDHLAKRKISSIRNRKKSIFESMVHNLMECILKNDELKSEYMNESKIDMDKVIERTKIMYTFLETVNTLKMENVNEEYLEKVINSIKE